MEKVLKYAFRITHIDNIPHILKNGLAKADSPLHDVINKLLDCEVKWMLRDTGLETISHSI